MANRIDPDSIERIYTASAGQVDFDVPFRVQRETDLTFSKLDGTAFVPLIYPDDFTVAGAGEDGGGTVTLATAAAAGDVFRLLGSASINRQTSIAAAGRFGSRLIDGELDRRVLIEQETRRDLDDVRARGLVAPYDEIFTRSLPAKADRALRAAAFDEEGEPARGPLITEIENAQAAAKNAGRSADAARAVYDNFDARYLGVHAADPATDNEGGALVEGALYWNSADKVMKTFNGAAWDVAYVSLSGALLSANNLFDLSDVAKARDNLSVYSVAEIAALLAALRGVAGNWSVGGTITSGGDLVLRRTEGNTRVRAIAEEGSAFIDADAPSGWSAMFRWLTGGVNRWSLHANANAETGDDIGSNLSLSSYHDDGTASATIFAVDRASHVMRIYSELQVPGQEMGDNSLRAANTAYVAAAQDAILWVRDERPSGEDGGSPPITHDFFARTLQTIEANNIAGASLSADQIMLPAGTYTIQASGQVYRTHWSRLRLYNVTGNATVIDGPMVHAWDDAAHQIGQHLMGRFVLSAPATLELQQIVNRNPGSSALGLADHWGQATVFAEALIRRIA